MSADLFSGGFAWADEAPVSQTNATPVATPDRPARALTAAIPERSVASVASVANGRSTQSEGDVSQAFVAAVATPAATPESAGFCGIEPSSGGGVAPVAGVAEWERGIDVVRAFRVPPADRDARQLQSDAVALMGQWGADLHALGWSTLDVWGSNRDPAHRRLDRLGLVHFIMGGQVDAIDSRTASIRPNLRDTWVFQRDLIAAGGVPLWQSGVGQGRWEGAGEAPPALPRPPAPSQPASGEAVNGHSGEVGQRA